MPRSEYRVGFYPKRISSTLSIFSKTYFGTLFVNEFVGKVMYVSRNTQVSQNQFQDTFGTLSGHFWDSFGTLETHTCPAVSLSERLLSLLSKDN